MHIDCIDLHHIELPYVHPFETSFGRELTRHGILVAVTSDGLTGWGECVAGAGPWYSYETIDTAWHVLRDYLAPAVLGHEVSRPEQVVERFRRVRGHAMARAAHRSGIAPLTGALGDALAEAEALAEADPETSPPKHGARVGR